jgi:hypothetical protein
VAAQQLDTMWDGWMVSLSASYAKTMELLDANKVREARDEYRMRFVPTVKKLYTEAPKTYPPRFAKINDWCSWAKGLYTMSLAGDKVLAGNDVAASKKTMEGLRAHFYALHRQAETLGVSDWIYAFRVATADAKPTADVLRGLRDKIDKAQLSVKAKVDVEAFRNARAEWLGKVDPILKDGTIDAAELTALRSATEKFYRGFGTLFE